VKHLGVVSVIAACAVFAASAQASHMRGVVPAHGQPNAAAKAAGTAGNLLYNGGPVMHTNQVYAIYWIPSGYSVGSGYQSTIDGFFTNVAAASGSQSNVYYSDTQYYDTINGNIAYSSSFGGAISDSDPYPRNGCRDHYTKVCLTDAQLQTEISRIVANGHYPTGTGTEYFLFTPENVGSCYGSSCAYSYFCAYHSNIGSGPSAILYANMPYAAYVPKACGSGESPNGNDADSTINVTSHEHNETITDPLGTAWYDASGYEDGDKCAWNFGTPLGGSAGAEYNQSINGAHYYLQQEWSNSSSGCVLTGL
jgi:hypothetical protein